MGSEIRIVTLKPARMAGYRAVSEHPEHDAFSVLLAWAKDCGLAGKKDTRFFGFDNPGPSGGKSTYGYEAWMTVGPEIGASGDIEITDFPGGLFAVKHTTLPRIGEAWREIVAWCKRSPYVESTRQCLEEHLALPIDTEPESMTLDLYLPIEE
jgi:DNA gyrase inhibitor GyrI